MQLSPNFSLAEMTRSETALRRNIDNTPKLPIRHNLKALCVDVLEPLRAAFGKPVVVTSGYRCQSVNIFVGGSGNSHHCQGYAADIHIPTVPLLDVAEWLRDNVEFDQIIFEFGAWVHVSNAPTMRRQCLTAVKQNGKTVYLQGFN